MTLTKSQAAEALSELKQVRDNERAALDSVRSYWTGRQGLPAVIPSGVPQEVRQMARMSRVNVCDIVVESLSQSLFAEGFRMPKTDDNLKVWAAWQANKMDARQSGIHRVTLAYGTGYAVVMPSKSGPPVIRGVSPRAMTTQYGDDPDWPVRALERLGGKWRIYDADGIYIFSDAGEWEGNYIFSDAEHPMKVCPIIRYLDTVDLDAGDEVEDRRVASLGMEATPTGGQVGKLVPLQDQIDFTTFNLLVAQHYSAFRQRYIIGWVAENEAQQMKASASKLWTFEDTPESVKVGEFEQTNLEGYLKSREASLRHAATLSQTPVHELIGELVNLSAEALAAAEIGRDRKVTDRQTLLGEAHEQMLWLVGQLMGVEVPNDAQMVWRDTSARAFGAVVDGLGKLAQMLGIPVEELWERVPGATKTDVDRWKAAKAAEPPEPEPGPAPAE